MFCPDNNYNTTIKKIPFSLIDGEQINCLTKHPVIKEGAQFIKRGEVVAFPTETVYGLGADATNSGAVKKIFEAKGRPQDNPLIVHISNIKQVKEVTSGELPSGAEKLINKFWPGPLTLILTKGNNISNRTTAGLDTVGVRMPSHPVALALIQAAGCSLAAPSANTSGKPSPTRARHVYTDLKSRLPYIIDGGSCNVGVESTVLDLRGKTPIILRPGGITREDISRVLGKRVLVGKEENIDSLSNETPSSPGMKYRHYSPEAPINLFSPLEEDNILYLEDFLKKEIDKKIALVLSEEGFELIKANFSNLSKVRKDQDILDLKISREKGEDIFLTRLGSRFNPACSARRMFYLLRYLDQIDIDLILVEALPEEGLGEAVMNRLHKAAVDYIYLNQ